MYNRIKIQIIYIHGGNTFRTNKDYIDYLKTKELSLEEKNSWSGEYLEKQLGSNFQIIRPRMPLKENSKYSDWKLYFERYLVLLGNNIVLIGSSLGGIFLAKYLSENKLTKKILATYLICPPFDNTLAEEDLVGGFKLKQNLSLIEQNTEKLYLFFSKDDKVVPYSHAEKYKNKLKNPIITIYKSKNGHFNIPKFPEIVKLIKNDVRPIKK